MATEVDETIKRILGHKGVTGVVVVNNAGVPIKSTLDPEQTVKYSTTLTQLAAKARSVIRELDTQNDMTFFRLRSKKHEIMVAPDKDYMLIVIQDSNTEA